MTGNYVCDHLTNNMWLIWFSLVLFLKKQNKKAKKGGKQKEIFLTN